MTLPIEKVEAAENVKDLVLGWVETASESMLYNLQKFLQESDVRMKKNKGKDLVAREVGLSREYTKNRNLPMKFQVRKLEYTETVQELEYLVRNFDVSTKRELDEMNFRIRSENVRINRETGNTTFVSPMEFPLQ